jgi:hypothetical protein
MYVGPRLRTLPPLPLLTCRARAARRLCRGSWCVQPTHPPGAPRWCLPDHVWFTGTTFPTPSHTLSSPFVVVLVCMGCGPCQPLQIVNPSIDCGNVSVLVTVSGLGDWAVNGWSTCASLNVTVVPDVYPNETSWYVTSCGDRSCCVPGPCTAPAAHTAMTSRLVGC